MAQRPCVAAVAERQRDVVDAIRHRVSRQVGAVEGIVSGVADGNGEASRPPESAFALVPNATEALPTLLVQPAPMLWPLSEAQEALADPAPLSAAAIAAAVAPPTRVALILLFIACSLSLDC